MGVFMSEYTEMPSTDPFSLIPLYKKLIGRLEMLRPPSIVPSGKTYGVSPGILALRTVKNYTAATQRKIAGVRAMAADVDAVATVKSPWWKDDERRNRRLKKLRATWAKKRRQRGAI